MQDGDFEGMVKALKMILRLRPRRIVPGHGPVSRTIEVRRFIKYFLELDRNSRKAIRKGLNGRELYQASIPAWSWNWSMRWVIESYLDNLTMKS
jgi:glyoxylase-like metal-dependent hydrolase (beta-lactamase superfamily II)